MSRRDSDTQRHANAAAELVANPAFVRAMKTARESIVNEMLALRPAKDADIERKDHNLANQLRGLQLFEGALKRDIDAGDAELQAEQNRKRMTIA